MAVHALCGSLSELISWISTKYCIVLMRALICMGRLPVSNSMTEYGVVALTPRCLWMKAFCIFSISFHEDNDIMLPHISTPYKTMGMGVDDKSCDVCYGTS